MTSPIPSKLRSFAPLPRESSDMEMLSFTRMDYVCRSISLFTQYIDAAPPNELNQRAHYFSCLNRVQRYSFPFSHAVDEWLFEFDLRRTETRLLVEQFLEGGKVSVEDDILEDESEQVILKVNAGLELLARYNYEAAAVAKLLIGCFVLARKKEYGGGSVSSELGVVWLSPPTYWEAINYTETILHESTHQAQFLDQMVHGWFVTDEDVMAQDDALVVSPVRRTKRPYHLTFDGTCVAVTLLGFYERMGMQENAIRLCQSLIVTLLGLREKSHFLTEHGKNLLREFSDMVVGSQSYLSLQETLMAAK